MVFVSHVLPWCTTAKVTEKKRLERNGILGFVVSFLLSELFGCCFGESYCFLGVGCVSSRSFVRKRLCCKILMFPGFQSDGFDSGAMFALKELACLIMILCCVY